MARVIEVIETWERKGTGKDKDPVRRMYQLWTKDGKMIFEEDGIMQLPTKQEETNNGREHTENSE